MYNSESITKSRVGDNGRMFAILFANNEDELMTQYKTIIREFIAEKSCASEAHNSNVE